jgi:hypothetical protein
MPQHNSGLDDAAAAASSKPGTSVCGEAIIDTQNSTKSTLKKQAPRSRFHRQYSIMERLRDLGINADALSLSDGPPVDNIYAQVAGVDIIVDTANAGDGFAWLAGRDVFIVKEKPARLFEPVSDDLSDAVIVIPLALAAEIALAAEDISCGLRPKRRRPRKVVRP